ncbi:MAG: RNA polymerase factor sigma-32 [Bdellovibrionales bacterium]|nr:RNA polymerase factor sigma-32 [Bdellovibrionales bacterium]
MAKKKSKTKAQKVKAVEKAQTSTSTDEFIDVEAEIVDEELTEADVIEPEIIEADSADSEPLDSDIDLSELSSEGAESSDSRSLAATDAMGQYMAEVARYPVLSKEDEQELAIRYRETGDPKAAEALVTANLRFVVKVAAEYTKFGSKLIDLVQEGNVGLMHAVKEFNPYKGVRLITYAVWWIRGYIQEYLMRQYSMVRIGTTANQRKLFYQLQKQKQELEELGYREGVKLLSGRLGISEKEVESMHKRLTQRDVSLDQPVSQADGSTTLMDFQTEDYDDSIIELLGTAEEVAILREKIDEIRPTLNDREIELLDERLLAEDPITLQEIGEKHGVSREAVRQMEARVIKKLRTALTE